MGALILLILLIVLFWPIVAILGAWIGTLLGGLLSFGFAILYLIVSSELFWPMVAVFAVVWVFSWLATSRTVSDVNQRLNKFFAPAPPAKDEDRVESKAESEDSSTTESENPMESLPIERKRVGKGPERDPVTGRFKRRREELGDKDE